MVKIPRGDLLQNVHPGQSHLINECSMTDEAGSTNAEISPDSESGSGSSSVSQQFTSESEESAEEELINDCNCLDDDLDQWLEEFAS